MEGDYISAHPEIRIELNDPTLLPITDGSHIKMTLNGQLININDPAVKITFSASNPKMVVVYKPALQDGSYSLLVYGFNAYGDTLDSKGTLQTFQVSNELKIMDCYNYPNPFHKDTYFTFRDGRDDAGDLLANGVYFYKMVISRNGEKHNITQKLAIIR